MCFIVSGVHSWYVSYPFGGMGILHVGRSMLSTISTFVCAHGTISIHYSAEIRFFLFFFDLSMGERILFGKRRVEIDNSLLWNRELFFPSQS